MSPRRLVVLVAIVLTTICSSAFAQEDVTAPVLLEFTISPVVFDTGQEDVVVDWCVRGDDDLSGVSNVTVLAYHEGGNLTVRLGVLVPVPIPGQSILLCHQGTFPQFSLFGRYRIDVELRDSVGNESSYRHPARGGGDAVPELCPIGPCELLNRQEIELPDTDGDGVPDDADSCPDIANADQADTDLDLMGDACDPFPNDRDNEQAQCDADLGAEQNALQQALATIDAMRACLASYKKENGVRCRDDVDNDCDGLIDGDDPDCQK